MRSSQVAPLFYFGTLISSVGSFAFNLALIAFMLKSGFDLVHASLIIGLQRFVPIVVTSVWGHLTDVLPVKRTVIVAEGIAVLSSLGLFFLWKGADTSYFLFSMICILRSIVVSFQLGSRSKISKFLADGTYAGNSRQAIWLNKATQGATLFGGLFAWIIIQYFNLETAILFDAFTFALNGVIVFLLPDFESSTEKENKTVSWNQKFFDLFQYNARAAGLDILLAISMMGTVAFMARAAGESQSWSGLFMAGFGLAVWVSGYLERGITSRLPTFPYWIGLGLSFLLIAKFHKAGVGTLALFFMKDLCYWTIYHRISSHIQMDTPTQKMGGVISARIGIMIFILAMGEILVGAWSSFVSIGSESLVRGAIAVGIGMVLLLQPRKVAISDRPAL